MTFTALQTDSPTLHLITEDNLAGVVEQLRGFPDSPHLLAESLRDYQPAYDRGRRVCFGFSVRLGAELAGLVALRVERWEERAGSTSAEVFRHMRGRGVAPGCKAHLFYLAFGVLGLHRVATVCRVSNQASRHSIEKTAGLRLEGVMRESGVNEHGAFEDECLYAILRQDWAQLYDPSHVTLWP